MMGENCAEEKKKRELLKKWIQESRNVVFFGGAGVSTGSGIPDFRSVDGLYNQEYDYPPETILSKGGKAFGSPFQFTTH